MVEVIEYVTSQVNTGWTNPNNILGPADVQCTSASIFGLKIWAFFGEHLVPDNATIDKVEIDVKGEVRSILEKCSIFISDGIVLKYVRSLYGVVFATCADTYWRGWLDLTNRLGYPWTAEGVNNMYLRFSHEKVGASCGDVPCQAWTSYLDAARVRITFHLPPCAILRASWPNYVAFAKRAFDKHYHFGQPTADNEVEQLIEEFVLRGLERCALVPLAAIAKTKGELAKAEEA